MSTIMDRPWVEIEVNGLTLPPKYNAGIISVHVESDEAAIDKVTITANDIDGEAGGRLFSDSQILAPGNSVVVWAGYSNQSRFAVGRFQLESREIQRSAGDETITVAGVSPASSLVDHKHPRAWGKGTLITDAIKSLAKAHDLSAAGVQVQSTDGFFGGIASKLRTKSQLKKPQNTSDWTFLQQLCYRAGYGMPAVRYDAKKKHDVLYAAQPSLKTQGGYWTFDYTGQTPNAIPVDAIRGGFSLEGMPTHLEITSRDPKTGNVLTQIFAIKPKSRTAPVELVWSGKPPKKLSKKIKNGAELVLSVLSAINRSKARPKTTALRSSRVTSAKSAKEYAISWWRTRQANFIAGECSTSLGVESLVTGEIIEVLGLGVLEDGLARVTSISHNWGASNTYQQTVGWRRIAVETQVSTSSAIGIDATVTGGVN